MQPEQPIPPIPQSQPPNDQPQTLSELLSDPKRWTQGDFARDAEGLSTHALDPDATCFCVLGGLQRLLFREPRPTNAWELYNDATHRLADAIDTASGFCDEDIITNWNDNSTHAEVLAKLREVGL